MPSTVTPADNKNHPSAPMRLIRALENLERHPVLQKVTLNHVIQYARLICHLKNDILLPQPLGQSDPNIPPDVLPLSLVDFLGLALKIKQEFIQDSWDILKYYVWECTTAPLVYEDIELFREFGCSQGIGMCCMNKQDFGMLKTFLKLHSQYILMKVFVQQSDVGILYHFD